MALKKQRRPCAGGNEHLFVDGHGAGALPRLAAAHGAIVLAPLHRKDWGAPTALSRPRELRDRVADLRRRGFVRAYVDGEEVG